MCGVHKLITLVTYREKGVSWEQRWKEDFSKCLFYFLNFDYTIVLPLEKIKTASKANNNNRLCFLTHHCTC